MAAATPEQMATWPEPNFTNPETRGPIVVGLTVSTVVLVIIFVVARFYGRGVLRNVLGIDDWMMGIAAILSFPESAIALVSLRYGLGLHMWDIKAEWAGPYYKMAFAADMLFPISCSLTKISLCLTYLRLFPSRSNKIFCWTLTVFVTLYTVACIFLMLFQCTPIRGYWDASAKQHCINLRPTLVSIAALNSLSDFLIYLWPAKPLWSLQLPLKQRLGLISIFTMGCTVCVAGICRMYYLEFYFESFDLYWNAAIIYAVMSIEMNLGIICGCMSGVKPVLAVLFPRLFTSSSRTNTGPTHQGRSRHPESFPFQPLSDASNLSNAQPKKLEHAVSVERIERLSRGDNGRDRQAYAWASSDGATDKDAGRDVPMNAIAVNQVVTVRAEEKREDVESRSQKSGNGGAGSEEWILDDDHVARAV